MPPGGQNIHLSTFRDLVFLIWILTSKNMAFFSLVHVWFWYENTIFQLRWKRGNFIFVTKDWWTSWLNWEANFWNLIFTYSCWCVTSNFAKYLYENNMGILIWGWYRILHKNWFSTTFEVLVGNKSGNAPSLAPVLWHGCKGAVMNYRGGGRGRGCVGGREGHEIIFLDR